MILKLEIQKKAWSGLKKVIGSSKKQDVKIPADTDPMFFANNLNNFFNRFDINQSNDDLTALKHALVTNVNEINDLKISTFSVEKVLRQIDINKAAGPDLLSGKIFKLCYGELAPVFSQLYNWSLNSSCIPSIWKSSIITPINKIPKPCVLNDYRPVALTSVVMKCFERIVKDIVVKEIKEFIDLRQFAYCAKKGVEGAMVSFLHPIYEHLDKPKTYVRTLFVEFSSAFNTIQVHILIQKLVSMNVNHLLSLWISDFLSNRTQRVQINKSL